MPSPFPIDAVNAELLSLRNLCLQKRLLPLLTIALDWDHPEQEAAFLWPEVLPKKALERLLEDELARLKETPSSPLPEEAPVPTTTHLIVTTNAPSALDALIQPFKAAVLRDPTTLSGYRIVQGGYLVRCQSDPDFVELLIEKEGHGTVIRRLKPGAVVRE